MSHNNTLSSLLTNYMQDGDCYAVRRARSHMWSGPSAPVTPSARETALFIEQYSETTLTTGAQVLIFPADGTPAQVVTLTADGWKTGDILT